MASSPNPTALLARQLVTLLSPAARTDLALVLTPPGGLALAAVPDGTLDEFARILAGLLHLDRGGGWIEAASHSVRKALLLGLRVNGSASASTDTPGRIREAIAEERPEEALSLFRAGGGMFFAHVHGLEAAQRTVNAFPESVRQGTEVLRLAEAINAMKAGSMAQAKDLVAAVHEVARTLATLCRQADSVSLDVICCRLVVAVSDEEPMEREVLELLFGVLERLPADAAMRRGMLYNVALDAFVRQGQWETAYEAALQARYHFTNARALLPAFYIELYFALIELARGNVRGAQASLAKANAALEQEPAHSCNDRRLLQAMEGICLYELGDAEPLTALAAALEGGVFGEIWPSIAGPLIYYGTRALALRRGSGPAEAYLGRWRLQQWRSERFAAEIAVSEVELLQSGGRWHAADEVLQQLAAAWRLGSSDILTGSAEAVRIEYHLRRRRAMLQTAAGDASLQASLEALLAGNRLTVRQRLAVLVWAVAAAQAREDWNRLRVLVGELGARVESTGMVAVLIEQQPVLRSLFGSREVRRRLASSARAARFLRSYAKYAQPDVHTATRGGLTRQEARILMLLVEGVANKTIARSLDVALPTVRYHIKNLYRKLGCTHRREVSAAARRLGLVGEPDLSLATANPPHAAI